MVSTRTETITARDGGSFAGHVALPAAGSGPGILVIQEIGGVNGYIKAVCERLADLG
jgi:carboxymethylenebutenolidase